MNLKMKVNGVEFEIEPSDGYSPGGEQATGIVDEASDIAKQTFDDVVSVVTAIAATAGTKFKSVAASAAPDEITMSFSVGVKASSGIVVQSSEVNAAFTVQLKWKLSPE